LNTPGVPLIPLPSSSPPPMSASAPRTEPIGR
jgi:hypothetical protein